MTNLVQGAPGVPQAPIAGDGGAVTTPWYSFFITLWQRTGGPLGSASIILDSISDVVGSTLYRAASQWVALAIGAKYQAMISTGDVPEWAFLDGNSFQNQAKSSVFIAPDNGEGIPSFRTLQTADLDPVAGAFPGTPIGGGATAGNVGEYLSDQIGSGAAIAVASGAITNIAQITLTPGDWDVWGSIATAPAGTTTQSNIKGWISAVSATDPGAPNQGCYAQLQMAIAAGLSQVLPLGSQRISVPAGAPETFYLSAQVSFAISTLGVYGFIGARRRR